MDIVFKKLKVDNRFANSFENWKENNVISFSNEGFIDIYAPNGVGKSSLARALNNENKSEYEYEYNGKQYNEKSKESPILVIDDFFFRNIATRDSAKLSDYILGSQIAKELELKEKIETSTKKVKDDIISYLKKEKCTVLFATNNPEDTMLGDTVIFMNDGKIINQCNCEDIIDNERNFIKANSRLPFKADLISKLSSYELVEQKNVDIEELVNEIWK